jgi:hypothetical protein
VNPVKLLVEIIKENAPKDIWQDSPLAGYRILGNTNRGEIGEEFVRRYLAQSKIKVTRGLRTALTDADILKSHLEIKTASLGANGTFQFNHVRLDRKYDYLLASGFARRTLFLAYGAKAMLPKDAPEIWSEWQKDNLSRLS